MSCVGEVMSNQSLELTRGGILPLAKALSWQFIGPLIMKHEAKPSPRWHAWLGLGIGAVSGLVAALALYAVTGSWVYFLLFPGFFAWGWYRFTSPRPSSPKKDDGS